jgi:hypothetical protein
MKRSSMAAQPGKHMQDERHGDATPVSHPAHTRLVQKAVKVLWAVEPLGSRYLDCDHPVQLLVPAKVNPAEVALPEQLDDHECANPFGTDGGNEYRLDQITVVRIGSVWSR